jgi:hypothetical protein
VDTNFEAISLYPFLEKILEKGYKAQALVSYPFSKKLYEKDTNERFFRSGFSTPGYESVSLSVI